jgi:hypothetical protein
LENDTTLANCSFTTATLPASFTVSGTENAKVLSIWIKDSAGNVSARVDTNSVTLDTTAPSLASATISNSSPTNTTTYNLSWGSITNTPYNRYCILENDTTLANCTFVTASLPTSFTVSGTENAKVLSVWIKDAAGNTSTRVDTNSVTLDTTAPSLASLSVTNSSPSSSTTYNLSWGSITNTPYASYCILENDTTLANCSFTAGTVPATFTTSSTENAKVLSAWLKDTAGNTSTRVDSNSVTLDLVPSLASATVTNSSPTSTTTYSLSFGATSGGSYNRYCILENDTTLSNCSFVTATLPSSFTVSSTQNAKVLSVWIKDSSNNVSARVDTNSVTYTNAPASDTSLRAPVRLWISAQDNSAKTVTLNWLDNSSDETGFEVERSTDGTSFSNITTTAANTTTYQNTGLTSGTIYWYRVRSARTTDSQTSAYTNIVSASLTNTATYVWNFTTDVQGTAKVAGGVGGTIARNVTAPIFMRFNEITEPVTNDPVTLRTTSVETWETWGVPTSSLVNSFTLDSYKSAATLDARMGSHSLKLSIFDSANAAVYTGTTVYDSGALSTTTWAMATTNVATSKTVLATKAASTTQVKLDALWTISTTNGAGSPSENFDLDDVSLTMNYSKMGTAVPSAPTRLTATQNGTAADLAWIDNSGTESAFRVETSANGTTGWSTLTTLGRDVTSYSHAGGGSSPVYYRVYAVNSTGDSTASNVAHITATPGPTLSIGSPSPASGPGLTTSFAWTITYSNTDTIMLNNSMVTISPSNISCSAAVSGTTGSTRTVTVTNCNPTGTTNITISIAANSGFNNAGFGTAAAGPSTAASATLLPPTAPSNLAATAGNQSVSLTWTDNSTNESGFKIQRSTDNSSWSTIQTTAADATSYNDTGLTGFQIYYYRIAGTNAGGDSSYTSSVNATPYEAPILASFTVTNSDPTNTTTYGLTYGTITNPYTQYCILENDTTVGNCSYTTGTVPASKVVSGTNNAKVLSIWLKNASGYVSTRIDANSVTLDTVTPQLASATITNSSPSASTTYNLTYGSVTNAPYDRYCILENDTTLANCSFTVGTLPSSFVVSSTANAKVLSIWIRDTATNTSTRVDTNSVTLSPQTVGSFAIVNATASPFPHQNTSTYASATRQLSAVLNSKLYWIWGETNGSAVKTVRVAVYNGDDNSPARTMVDTKVNGSTVTVGNGINVDASLGASRTCLATVSGKLYAVWQEGTKIQAAEYNGNDGAPDWTHITPAPTSNGLNYTSTNSTSAVDCASFNNKLFVTWVETATQNIIHVRVYDPASPGWSWSSASESATVGIETAGGTSASGPRFAVQTSGTPALWITYAQSVGGVGLIKVKKTTTGTSWTVVNDTGINISTSVTATLPAITMVGTNAYVTWMESSRTRLKKYDGSSWSAGLGDATNGINYAAATSNNPFIITVANKVYITWQEQNAAVYQVRVKRVDPDNSDALTFIDGGAATGLNRASGTAISNQALDDFGGKLYLHWSEGASGSERQHLDVGGP